MSDIADSQVSIQTSAQSVPSTPSWFGQVAVIAHYLRRLGVLTTIAERVRFARRRFGHYDLIDFAAVLLGYAISGERTLEAFYERVQPFAAPFMAQIAARTPPSSLDGETAFSRHSIKLLSKHCALCFSRDLVARPLEKEEKTGGLWDRQGTQWLVFDVDGTRQAARVSRFALHT